VKGIQSYSNVLCNGLSSTGGYKYIVIGQIHDHYIIYLSKDLQNHGLHIILICNQYTNGCDPFLFSFIQLIMSDIHYTLPISIHVFLIKYKIFRHYKLSPSFSRTKSMHEEIIPHIGKLYFQCFMHYYKKGNRSLISLGLNIENKNKNKNKNFIKGGGIKRMSNYFSISKLNQYIAFDMNLCLQSSFLWEYLDHVDRKEAHNHICMLSDSVACSIPLKFLFQKICKLDKIKVAHLHDISYTNRDTVVKLNSLMSQHECSDICKNYLSVFRFHNIISNIEIKDFSKTENDIYTQNKYVELDPPIVSTTFQSEKIQPDTDIIMDDISDTESDRKFIYNQQVDESPVFPPTPLSKEKVEKIINSFCKSIESDYFEEAGCIVCGQLCISKNLVDKSIMKNSFNILCRPG